MATMLEIVDSYATVTCKLYVDYSYTDYADRRVYTSKIVAWGRNVGSSVGPTHTFHYSANNSWTINGSTYSGKNGTLTLVPHASPEGQSKDASSSQTTTVYKTHSQQTISASANYRGNEIDNSPSVNGTVYATLTVPAKTSYAVSYNANGGTGSIANQTKWYGESLTLSNGNAFTRANYKLVRWNTKADGTGTNYSLSQAYTGNEALTLYAVWELNAVPAYTKVGGAIKKGILYVKVNGAIKIPYAGYVKVNGTWKQIKEN